MIRSRVATLLLASLLACTAGAVTAQAQDLKVVATIKPIQSIIASVMAGVGEPGLLVDGAASPHSFALKPSDARLVNSARLFFRVSETLEPFTEKLIKSLPKSVTVVTLASAPGLRLHALRAGGSFEAHTAAAHGHGHDHGHGHSGKPGANEVDGHIWLDPENAKAIARHAAEALAAARPADAGLFRANAEKFATDADQLAREIETKVAGLAGRPYLVFHDAYQYFERRFNLAAAGSVTVSPDVPPSAKRLTELRRKVAQVKAVCVFAEPQFAPKVIDTLVEGMAVRKGVLDPLGAALPAGPAHYAALLRGLATDLSGCLANPA